MVRAILVCAFVFAVRAASAEGTASQNTPTLAEPTVADASTASACGERDCPATATSDALQTPADPAAEKKARLRQLLAELNCLQSEIDTLREETGTPQQVAVTIQLVEVQRTKLHELGIDFTLNDLKDGKVVRELLPALEKNNVAKVLANPTLTVVCGMPASFHAGGAVPLPSAVGNKGGADFRRTGTEVELLATALGDNRVQLNLRALVSSIDQGREIELNGVQVPALKVRQIETPLTMTFGETAVLSGSIETRIEALKRTDGSIVKQPNDIELLCVVTAEAMYAGDSGVGDSVSADEPYHTATAAPEVNPAERSLRVTKPYTPR